MTALTQAEYIKEVAATAAYVVATAAEFAESDGAQVNNEEIRARVSDSILHEEVDGHQYVIYTRFHLPILELSDNAEYMIDELGDGEAAHALKTGGLCGLHAALAYWAFYADVAELIDDEIDEYLESIAN